MKDITENFGTLYQPKAALVVYEANRGEGMYVEYFDMDVNGSPINAHPLTVKEAQAFVKALNTEKDSQHFLKPKGIMPTNVLHVDPANNGRVIWYTKAQQRQLFFVENLGIPNGKAFIPAMLWIATNRGLSAYALKNDRRPNQETVLCHAPFFNIYSNGNVCMGTVSVSIKKSASLEDFTAAWEDYFFNSYFSHLMEKHQPVLGNCVSLWKKLVKTGEAFPKDVLIPTKNTLKNLLK